MNRVFRGRNGFEQVGDVDHPNHVVEVVPAYTGNRA